jgi:hypothetical protein
MNLKSEKVQKYWGNNHQKIDYSKIDQAIIKKFNGTHPQIIKEWLPKDKGLFQADPNYKPSKKQKKHRMMIKLENYLNLELSKKHYKLV